MNNTINNNERLNLKKLVDEMDCDDNTENIRKLKHSVLIRNDIRKIENLKTKNAELKKSKPDEFITLCEGECPFLFNNYTDIFHKVVKDELDLTIMTKLLTVLKMIEDGKVDQHEGSVLVGKILKELYIDSAVKRADNIDKEYESMKVVPNEGKKISWQEFKSMNK
jgi:hypothetical protein|uniref:Uncharacterized protein n=1 Tax=viral metagenome TaxID=1070528 RepID=A0A6C0DNG2_9ZZZZ